MVVLVLLVFFILIVLSYKQLWFWRNRPPGPYVFPLMGSFPGLLKSTNDAVNYPYEAMHQLGLKYGPVMSVGLGPEVWVVLSNIEAIKQFCMMEETVARPVSQTFHEIYSFAEVDQPLGVIFADGPLWREHRKFMTKTLREMGVGKKNMDQQIIQEIHILSNHLKEMCEKNSVLEMQRFFDLPSLNVIWQLVCGRRFDYHDQSLLEMIEHIEAFTMEKYIGPIVGTKGLKYLSPFKEVYKSVKNHMEIFKSYLSKVVSESKKMSSHDVIDDGGINYMSAYFEEQSKETKKLFTDKQLIISMQDFFTGGSGTMSKTMSYGILYLMTYPEVQKKVQKEINQVLSDMNVDEVNLEMKSQLPYTEATISEIQRLASVLPIAPPRLATKDVQVNGYAIPKGTQVQCNLYSLHRNPDHWPEPDLFKPERFLSPDESEYRADEWLQPFGYGKRKCLGESVAKSTIFLFLANLIHRFTFSIDPTGEKPSLLPEGGLTIGPKKFFAKVLPRF